jgi:hypothetical protein
MTGSGSAGGVRSYDDSIVSIYHSHFVSDAAIRSYGIQTDTSDSFIFDTRIDSTGGDTSLTWGLHNTLDRGGPKHITCVGCYITSSGPTVESESGLDVKIANSTLNGLAVVDPDGGTKCSFVQDENFDSFVDSCP